MARQVIGESITIRLPEYRDCVESPSNGLANPLIEKFVVTPERALEIDAIEIEKEFFGVVFDVCGSVGGFPFLIYLTHPGRTLPPEVASVTAEKCGAVELSLQRTYLLFMEAEGRSGSYLDSLRSFLESNLESKRWIAHPRYGRARERAEKRLQSRRCEVSLPRERQQIACSSAGVGSGPLQHVRTNVESRRVKYQCVMCRHEWEGVYPGYSECPNCNTHLYMRVVEDLGK